MNYEWEILSLRTSDQTNSDGAVLQNAVVNIQWKKIATDADGNVATYLGNTLVSAENVAVEEFVLFQDLTKEKIIEWIISNTSDRDLILINQALERRLSKKTTTERSVPWSLV